MEGTNTTKENLRDILGSLPAVARGGEKGQPKEYSKGGLPSSRREGEDEIGKRNPTTKMPLSR